MIPIKNLRQLFIHQLQHLHVAETQVSLIFPKLAKLAHNSELRGLFEKHGKNSMKRIQRAEASLKQFDQKPTAKICHVMVGLIKEANHLLANTDDNGVKDSALATIAHQFQQHEISAYTLAKAQAQNLGYKQMVESIQATLDDGTEDGMKLLKLASKKLHGKAMAGV